MSRLDVALVTLGLLTAGLVAQLVHPDEAGAWQPSQTCGAGVYSRWPTPPVQYYVNSSQSGATATTTRALTEASFARWRAPCCSGATSSLLGESTLSPLSNGDGNSVIGFANSIWPNDLGDPYSTLGVTITLSWGDCSITEADIIFNEVNFNFCYGTCGSNQTNYETVATHEIGHVFGMGHTAVVGAVMYPSQTPGTPPDLSADDETGICTIYPDDHCGCSGPGDCDPGQSCVGNVCVDPPQDCGGVVCPAGEACVGSQCTCATCVPCTEDDQCGTGGSCMDVGAADGQNHCIYSCGPGVACPGDSICFKATSSGNEIYICLNDDAATVGLCPSSYTCTSCEDTGCPPGEMCFEGGCRADPTNVICASTDDQCSGCDALHDQAGCVGVATDRIVCTVTCHVNADCGSCGACVASSSNPNVSYCVNNDQATVGYCPAGWTCDPVVQPGQDAGVTGQDAGATGQDAGGDAGTVDPGRASGNGCSCQTTRGAGAPAAGALLLLLWGLVCVRRRRSGRG